MNIPSPVPHLDLFTVKVMTLVSAIIVSFACLLTWRVNRRVAGLRLIAIGMMSLSAGGMLGLARIIVAGYPIIIACNVLVVGGMITTIQGIRASRSLPSLPRGAVLLLTATVSVFYFYWMFVHDSFAMRVGVISPTLALLALDASVSMIRRVPKCDRPIYWPTGIAFAFAAAYLTVRTAGALTGLYGGSFLYPAPIEIWSTICANIAFIGCAFGMLLASNTQQRHDAEKMAHFDPLTNLPNRRFVLDRLVDAERRALATGQHLGVIYLDLDEFKLVNDTLGHAAGDDLLKAVSATMARVLRAGDCIGRIGGDEFIVLTEQVQSRSEIVMLAERLKAAVESAPLTDGYAVPMSVSCGVAIFPEDGQSAHDVLREADAAMYNSKRRTRVGTDGRELEKRIAMTT